MSENIALAALFDFGHVFVSIKLKQQKLRVHGSLS